jgi:hypothetical protein
MMDRGCRSIFAGAAMLGMYLAGAAAAPQTPRSNPRTSDQVFKNIKVLKGIPLDDFMGTMGIMSTALGVDCSECHTGAGTETVDWAADTPRKVIARTMVQMMNAINRNNFAGHQVVTCWTCHHGRDRPATTPTIENVYGPGSQEMDDILTQIEGQPSPDAIVNKYIQALGGAQRVAAVKSYISKGTSVGFGGFGKGGRVEILAQYPDRRATFIDFPDEPARGDSVRTFNGRAGWLRTPLTVLGEYELTGGELDGARIDAMLSFPAQIKEALSHLRVSLPTTISDLPAPSSQASGSAVTPTIGQDRLVNVVQGTGLRDSLATLYFDQESGLLVRMVRYGNSPIGRVPTQIDFGDYRDVGGIKMPFRMIFGWMDGRDAIQLNEVKLNVHIDQARFGRPAPSKTR